MRGLIVFVAVLAVVECHWSYSEEYVFSGKGSATKQMVPNKTNDFCYLSYAQAFHSPSEKCNITVFHDSYYLDANSGEKSFQCGSRCIENFPGLVTQPFYLTGAGTEQKTLFPVGSSFCYLIAGEEWRSSSDSCEITSDSKYWYLKKTSKDNPLVCGAQCVNYKVKLTDEVILNGKGTQYYNMEVANNKGFCFLTKGQLFDTDESCHVHPGTTNWELEVTSKQDGFQCGARCVLM